MALSLNFDTIESREKFAFRVPRQSFLIFMYINSAWFILMAIVGMICSKLGSISNGFYRAPNAHFKSMMNMFDFTMAIVFLASNKLLLSINILRLFRVVMYLSQTRQGWTLKEIIEIFRKTLAVTLSIIFFMLVCLIFFSMLIHITIVDNL